MWAASVESASAHRAVMDEAKHLSEHGIRFREPKVDLDALRAWKNKVVGKLTGGLRAWRARAK